MHNNSNFKTALVTLIITPLSSEYSQKMRNFLQIKMNILDFAKIMILREKKMIFISLVLSCDLRIFIYWCYVGFVWTNKSLFIMCLWCYAMGNELIFNFDKKISPFIWQLIFWQISFQYNFDPAGIRTSFYNWNTALLYSILNLRSGTDLRGC